MGPLTVGEAVAGGLLIFVVPGFAVAKALFPERRVRGAGGVRWAVELATLALVLSVVLTVLVGYLLLSTAPGGFSASWSDPVLEAALAAIALVAFVAGLVQGAYARPAPRAPALRDDAGEEGAWELSERLGALQRARAALTREQGRRGATDPEAAAELKSRRAAIDAEERQLQQQREAEYER